MVPSKAVGPVRQGVLHALTSGQPPARAASRGSSATPLQRRIESRQVCAAIAATILVLGLLEVLGPATIGIAWESTRVFRIFLRQDPFAG